MRSSLLYVAVDPGLTTGIAWYWTGGAEPAMASEQLPAMEAVEEISSFADLKFAVQMQTLIVENFIPRRNTALTWQPDALHVIGALRYFAWKNKIHMILQNPIPKQRQAGLERELRKRRLWKPSEGGHENAARKHLLMALQREGLL